MTRDWAITDGSRVDSNRKAYRAAEKVFHGGWEDREMKPRVRGLYDECTTVEGAFSRNFVVSSTSPTLSSHDSDRREPYGFSAQRIYRSLGENQSARQVDAANADTDRTE